MRTVSSRLEVREVTASTWQDFESLFESKGAPSYCWCMAWRATAEEKKGATNTTRKGAMKGRVDNAIPIGLLGYLDNEVVAWCSVAPSTTYQRLRKDEAPANDVWSIVCFFILRKSRGQGLAKVLLEAAIHHAGKRGARIVEGYPVDPDSPSYRYMGFLPMFEEAGFREVAKAGSRRHVVRRRAA
jgi:GNAT superfamily N-acetyltransferase